MILFGGSYFPEKVIEDVISQTYRVYFYGLKYLPGHTPLNTWTDVAH